MEQYLIDINVIFDYLSASFPVAGRALMDTAINAIPNNLRHYANGFALLEDG